MIPYAFLERSIPNCMSLVPLVESHISQPTKEYLDNLYIEYSEMKNFRKVEGFIINNNENIKKYVRFKDGKLTEHKGE